MGLFDKLKNILFVEDELEETMSDIPIYPKKESKVEESKKENSSEEIKPFEGTRFKNVKRDIDLDSELEDKINVQVELEDTQEIINKLEESLGEKEKKETRESIPKEIESSMPQRRSVFQSFDAEEFDKVNGRLVENEKKSKEMGIKRQQVLREEKMDMSQARLANNNFSATKPSRREIDPDRYKLDTNPRKKPFKPSEVISPVYGVLNKNYTAEEIVDKKDGMKREIINTVIRTPDINPNKTIEEAEQESGLYEEELSVESVRRKAFGSSTTQKKEVDVVSEVQSNLITDDETYDAAEEFKFDDIELKQEVPVVEEVKEEVVEEVPEVVEEVVEEPTLNDDELRSRFIKDELEDEEDNTSTLLDDDDDIEEDKFEGDSITEIEEEQVDKKHILDDVEKTSTLQILDDIEKELNSIKTSVDKKDDEDVYSPEERLERNDTLENDLFNLIDSMYDDGEEEEE